MTRSPSSWDLAGLLDYAKSRECECEIDIGGIRSWVPARPMKNLNTFWERLRLARAVFRGDADALFWPGQ